MVRLHLAACIRICIRYLLPSYPCPLPVTCWSLAPPQGQGPWVASHHRIPGTQHKPALWPAQGDPVNLCDWTSEPVEITAGDSEADNCALAGLTSRHFVPNYWILFKMQAFMWKNIRKHSLLIFKWKSMILPTSGIRDPSCNLEDTSEAEGKLPPGRHSCLRVNILTQSSEINPEIVPRRRRSKRGSCYYNSYW